MTFSLPLHNGTFVKCLKLTDLNNLPSVPQIRELVPESQAYMDLLAFERKLDQTIMRKRVDIQEALKRPMKVASLQCTHCTSRCQSDGRDFIGRFHFIATSRSAVAQRPGLIPSSSA